MNDLLPIATTQQVGKPIVIAGPCSAESEEQVLRTAHALAEYGIKIFRAGIWKPRTKPGGFEGVGEPGLEWLKTVKAETGMLVCTEVANKIHVEAALKAGIDMVWIGARTSANPFAVQEIADSLAGTDMPVLVKNPVNPDLELWIGAIERIYNAGIHRLAAIHRGFTAYGKHLYRNMPQWHIPIELHRRLPNLQIICDPSHIGGKRELIAPLSQQALDMGFDGPIGQTYIQLRSMAFNYTSETELLSRYPVYTCENSGKEMSALWTLRDMQSKTWTPANGMDSMPIPGNDLKTYYQQGLAEFFAGARELTPENWQAFLDAFDKIGGAAWNEEGIAYAQENGLVY